ncbi:cell surface hyaluronidase CEMIP2-like [Argopecten irradians]|uniref:cell surface hyaluronidase CEMIP2-like n=1 Tax=Argopecten irradians TaxID=31199 RepID=UPI00371D6228
MLVARFLLVLVVINVANAACPHTDAGLNKWSESSTWQDGLPEDGDDVVIVTPILLDESPDVDLGSITISAGGRLVFAPDSDLVLRTYYIHIDGGRMDIGSEDCRYSGKARIQLLGTFNETYTVPNFGRKFIGVDVDGTLEIHGQDKLSWTKITDSIEKLPDDAFTSRDVINKEDDIKGLIVKSYDPTTGTEDREQGVFKLGSSSEKGVEKATDAFIAYADAIPDGNIVAIAVRKFIIDRENVINRTRFFDALETLGYGEVTGESQIRNLVFYDGFTMILTKGDPTKTVEGFEPYKVGGLHQTSTATYYDMNTDLKYFVLSYTKSRGFGKSFVEFQVTHIAQSCPIVDVVDDVSSWKTGDRVIITSTDYEWEQLEVGKVMDCDSCLSKQVKVDLSAKFTHYGKIYKNVDMRAEIAVLTRNVVIEGIMEGSTDEFGGHIKALKGFKDFHIEGAELFHMGQSTSTGNYPIHWHMCEDVDDASVYPSPTYARQNSIHLSYARCVTVHGTHGATVADNVCFDTIGHGYFLEDGGEKRTTLSGNLGAGQMSGDLTPTDKTPSTFWITNPLTVMENNVAAGGEGMGIWYIFPKKPMGQSAGKDFMKAGEAQETAITKFNNNVAHSNRRDGLRFENWLKGDGTDQKFNEYRAKVTSLDPNSDFVLVELNRITAYKNSIQNAVIRGSYVQVKDSSFSDSPKGLVIKRVESGQEVLNSVFVGDSDNTGEPVGLLDRSLPDVENPDYPRLGLVLGGGPVVVDDVWFGDYSSNAPYDTGAISFTPNAKLARSPRTIFKNVGFGFDDDSEGNRVLQLFPDAGSLADTIRVDIFQDESGDITDIPGSSVVRPSKLQLTSNCAVRDGWKMAICDEKFAQVVIKAAKDESVTLMRSDDITNNQETSDESCSSSAFNVILGGTYTYLARINTDLPSAVSVSARGLDDGEEVVIGLCVPTDLTFKLKYKGATTVRDTTSVNSLDALISDDSGKAYYFDDAVGVIFVKLTGTEAFPITGRSRNCANGICPSANIGRMSTSDKSDTDCVAAYKAKYGSTGNTRRRFGWRRSLSLPSSFPKSSVDPPPTAGAGSTRSG